MRRILIFLLISQLGAKKLIVTSVSPLRLIVNEIVDTADFRVINIVPEGQNPHTFDPRPGDIKKIQNACLFVYISDISEAWAPRLLENLKRPPRAVKIWPLLGRKETIRMNPHFWFNPENVRKIALPLGDSIGVCGKTRTRLFVAKLDSLDIWIRENLSRIKKKCFVPSHNSWTVFAEAYGINTTDVLWTSEGTELSPRKIVRIMKQARKCGTNILVLDIIYNKDLVSPFVENGFKVVTLDPQGWKEYLYTDYMRKNLKKLFEALDE